MREEVEGARTRATCSLSPFISLTLVPAVVQDGRHEGGRAFRGEGRGGQGEQAARRHLKGKKRWKGKGKRRGVFSRGYVACEEEEICDRMVWVRGSVVRGRGGGATRGEETRLCVGGGARFGQRGMREREDGVTAPLSGHQIHTRSPGMDRA